MFTVNQYSSESELVPPATDDPRQFQFEHKWARRTMWRSMFKSADDPRPRSLPRRLRSRSALRTATMTISALFSFPPFFLPKFLLHPYTGYSSCLSFSYPEQSAPEAAVPYSTSAYITQIEALSFEIRRGSKWFVSGRASHLWRSIEIKSILLYRAPLLAQSSIHSRVSMRKKYKTISSASARPTPTRHSQCLPSSEEYAARKLP